MSNKCKIVGYPESPDWLIINEGFEKPHDAHADDDNEEMDFSLLEKFSLYSARPSDKKDAKRYMQVALDLRENHSLQEESLILLEEGMYNYPEDFLLIYSYAKALYHLDYINDAKDAVDDALKMRPDDEKAKDLLSKITNPSLAR